MLKALRDMWFLNPECKQRMAIPIAAFQFWGQKDYRTLLFQKMDNSVFFKFTPDEEINPGIAYMLLEILQLCTCINMLNLNSVKS